MKGKAKEEIKSAAGAKSQTVVDDDKIDPQMELELLSKVMKVGNVEEFDWQFNDNVKLKGKSVKLSDGQNKK